MMIRRHHVLVAVTFAAAAALAAGCGDPEQATPRVTFDSTVIAGANDSQSCPEAGTWFKIGSFGNPAAEPKIPVHPVDDGAADQQGTVSVTCSVVPANDGFNVRAHAELSGATGGAFTIEGFFTAQGDQNNVTVALGRRGTTYTASDCVARYTTQFQGVAAGRVWAEVTCPKAEAPSIQRVCEASAQFRFENCTQ